MIDSMNLLCERLQFPQSAGETLCAAWAALSDPAAGEREAFQTCADELFNGKGNTFLDVLAGIAARRPDIPRETLDMAFLLSCLPELQERYRRASLPADVFWETMADLRCKLTECRRVRGVWGTFVTDWYASIFRMKCFAVGRLEYERRAFPAESFGGLKKGDLTCACHIPSSGPLTDAAVDDSLRRARAFYADVRVGDAFPVICHSWLLYPPVAALFPKDSNMARFAARFRIFDVDADPRNKDAWRVFDRPFDPENIGALPEDTSLRRALKQYLSEGNCMGNGYGLILA